MKVRKKKVKFYFIYEVIILKTHKVIIKHTYDSFKLLLDDFEVKGVTSYELKCNEGEVPKLTVTLAVVPDEVKI